MVKRRQWSQRTRLKRGSTDQTQSAGSHGKVVLTESINESKDTQIDWRPPSLDEELRLKGE
jgi:hypothetical protein